MRSSLKVCPHCGEALPDEMIGLTERQACVLEFVVDFIASNGFSPSYREIMKGIGVSSMSVAFGHVKQLCDRGAVTNSKYSNRSIYPTANGLKLLRNRKARQAAA